MRLIHGLGIISTLISTSLLAEPHHFDNHKPYATSGILSIAPQQFGQLNVVNIGVAGRDVCNLTLEFFDSDNQLIGTAQDFVVDGGQSVSFQTPVIDAQVEMARAVVDFTNQKNLVMVGQARAKACLQIIPTFEVADSAGTKVIDTNFRVFGLPEANSPEKIGRVAPEARIPEKIGRRR
jgi:hypothetical protein